MLVLLIKAFAIKRLKKFMFKKIVNKIKEKAAVKAASSLGSATMAVASSVTVAGLFIQFSPELQDLVTDLVPDKYDGLAVALLGVVVALARLRTLGKTEAPSEPPEVK